MGFYVRCVLTERPHLSLDRFADFLGERGAYAVAPGGEWREFEVTDSSGETLVAGDLTSGEEIREEIEELRESAEDADELARERVLDHLDRAVAVVGMQVLTSAGDDALAAARAVAAFLEKRAECLTQVDLEGWYDGSELILEEAN